MVANRQGLYVLPVFAHLQVLARIATVPLEVRCKLLPFVLIGNAQDGAFPSDHGCKSALDDHPLYLQTSSLHCAAALQDNGCNYTMLGYLFIKRSVLFCANNMPCCAPT